MRKPRVAGCGRPTVEPLEDRRLLSGLVGSIQPAEPVTVVVRANFVGPTTAAGGDQLTPFVGPTTAAGGAQLTPVRIDGLSPVLTADRGWMRPIAFASSGAADGAFTPMSFATESGTTAMGGPGTTASYHPVINLALAAATASWASSSGPEASASTSTSTSSPGLFVPASGSSTINFSSRPWFGTGWGGGGGGGSSWSGGDGAGWALRSLLKGAGPADGSLQHLADAVFSPWSGSGSTQGSPGGPGYRGDGPSLIQVASQILGQSPDAIWQHLHENPGSMMVGPGNSPPPVGSPTIGSQGRSGDGPTAIAAGPLTPPPCAASATKAKEDGSRASLTMTEIMARGGVFELTAGLQPALLLGSLVAGLLPGGPLPSPSMPASEHGQGDGADPTQAAGLMAAQMEATPGDAATEPGAGLASPEGAGLIAEALPADGRSLQASIERFLDRLTEITPGDPDPSAHARGGPISVGVLGLLAMTLAARRRLRSRQPAASARRRREDREGDQVLEFPELPGSWSTRLT